MSVPSTKVIDFSDPTSASWAYFAEILIKMPELKYYETGKIYSYKPSLFSFSRDLTTSHNVVRVKRKAGKSQAPEDDRFEVLEPKKFGDGAIADTRRSIMTLILKEGVLIQYKTYPLPEGARRIFKTQELEEAKREYQALTLAMPESTKPLVEWGDKATIGMRFFHGPSLYSLLRQPMTEEEAIAYSIQVLTAYQEYVRKFGLIFRDFKPEHFLLTNDGKFRIIDYGFAVKAKQVEGQTGTPIYMSPEAWGLGLRRGYTTAASDRYSIGVVLSEAWGGLFNERDKAQLFLWKNLYPRIRRQFPNLGTRFVCHPENKTVASAMIHGLTENEPNSRLDPEQVKQQFRSIEYHYSIDVLNLNPKTENALRQLLNSDPNRTSWKQGDYALTYIPGPNKPLMTRHFSLIQSLEAIGGTDKHHRVLSSTGAILDTLRDSDFQLTERQNLKKLQDHIEKTYWKVGLQFRKTTIQTKDKKVMVVPKHVKQIWDLNQKVLSNPGLEIRELRETESKVLALGQKAASKFSLFRKADTKKFYENFKASKDFGSVTQRLR